MNTILDDLKTCNDEKQSSAALINFVKENPDALETVIKANLLFLDKFPKADKEVLYMAYRETARAYKKKNLIMSNYPYDSQNYIEAADYYLKASEVAPDDGRKLSSLDGAASMYWNLDNKTKWCKVKLQQAEIISDKDKTRLFMDVARETVDDDCRKALYQKALDYAEQMSGDVDIKAEMISNLKKLI